MKNLDIRNIGPLKSASLKLSKYNIFIGPQSSGKSCILKIASFCEWIEKRIELSQSPNDYLNKEVFWKGLVDFHKLNGYIKNNFRIKYETPFMVFVIKGSPENIVFEFKWKPRNKWQYRRPQVAYIPAERNIVAAIPNWFDIVFNNENNIQSYMSDWEDARISYQKYNKLNILNLGLSYYYEPEQRREGILIDSKTEIPFTNASSGLQSVVPLCGIVRYLTFYRLGKDRRRSINTEKELDKLQNILYKERFTQSNNEGLVGRVDDITDTFPEPRIKFFGSFTEEKMFSEIIDHYSRTQYTSIFLEEPEENLFPSTQYELVKWLARQINITDRNTICIASHSPYILTAFNNLIQATECYDQKTAETIIGKDSSIPFDDINVYAVANGIVKDIKDYDLRLISQTELDSASDSIASDFSKLIEL